MTLYKYSKFLIVCLALLLSFAFVSFSSAASLPSTTSLTSLALSNIYASSSGSSFVLRATGVGGVVATFTTGIRYTFSLGTVYLGAGSVPGTTLDLNSEDWTGNVVWQGEININLSKVGDWLAGLFKNSSSAVDSKSTNK